MSYLRAVAMSVLIVCFSTWSSMVVLSCIACLFFNRMPLQKSSIWGSKLNGCWVVIKPSCGPDCAKKVKMAQGQLVSEELASRSCIRHEKIFSQHLRAFDADKKNTLFFLVCKILVSVWSMTICIALHDWEMYLQIKGLQSSVVLWNPLPMDSCNLVYQTGQWNSMCVLILRTLTSSAVLCNRQVLLPHLHSSSGTSYWPSFFAFSLACELPYACCPVSVLLFFLQSMQPTLSQFH